MVHHKGTKSRFGRREEPVGVDDDDTMSGAARSWFQPMAQMTARIVIVTLTRPAILCLMSYLFG